MSAATPISSDVLLMIVQYALSGSLYVYFPGYGSQRGIVHSICPTSLHAQWKSEEMPYTSLDIVCSVFLHSITYSSTMVFIKTPSFVYQGCSAVVGTEFVCLADPLFPGETVRLARYSLVTREWRVEPCASLTHHLRGRSAAVTPGIVINYTVIQYLIVEPININIIWNVGYFGGGCSTNVVSPSWLLCGGRSSCDYSSMSCHRVTRFDPLTNQAYPMMPLSGLCLITATVVYRGAWYHLFISALLIYSPSLYGFDVVGMYLGSEQAHQRCHASRGALYTINGI
jgi:hypothetical protein